jgi:hypothetical protein
VPQILRRIISNDSAKSHIARPERNRAFFMDLCKPRRGLSPKNFYHPCRGGRDTVPSYGRAARKSGPEAPANSSPTSGRSLGGGRTVGAVALVGAVVVSKPWYRLEKPFHNPNLTVRMSRNPII